MNYAASSLRSGVYNRKRSKKWHDQVNADREHYLVLVPLMTADGAILQGYLDELTELHKHIARIEQAIEEITPSQQVLALVGDNLYEHLVMLYRLSARTTTCILPAGHYPEFIVPITKPMETYRITDDLLYYTE